MARREENHRLPSLRSEVESFFSRALGCAPGPLAAHWLPALDLIEKPAAYVIETDVPGVRLEDLLVSVTGRRLTLRGRRGILREFAGSRIRLRERWSGEFARSIDLPGPVEAGRMMATLREGILRIELPRRERRP